MEEDENENKSFKAMIQKYLKERKMREEIERMERYTEAVERYTKARERYAAMERTEENSFLLTGILAKEDYRIFLDVGKEIGFLNYDYSLNYGISKAKFLMYVRFLGDYTGITNCRQVCANLWYGNANALKHTRNYDNDVYEECVNIYKRLLK